MEIKKKVYLENLDGLRFFCFLSIFLFHSFRSEYSYIQESPLFLFIKTELVGNANLGVNFFFVLSGFLITYLLIEEKRMNGQIDLTRFWFRRVLRIWPLFYFCVLFGFLFFPMLKAAFGQPSNESASLIYYLLFINNFDFIKAGVPDASILAVLWSVAIEEQFYLFWPIILYLLPIKRYWIAFLSILLLSLFFRAFNDVKLIHEYHTLSCIGDMSIGAFGAWLYLEKDMFRQAIVKLNKATILFIYFLLFFIYFFRDDFMYVNFTVRIFERQFISIVMLMVILEQCFAEKSYFKMANFKYFTKLGVITYGLYCLHFIGILIAAKLTKVFSINTELWQVLVVETFLALSSTIVLSKLSYRYFETPFLKLKDRFSYISK